MECSGDTCGFRDLERKSAVGCDLCKDGAPSRRYFIVLPEHGVQYHPIMTGFATIGAAIERLRQMRRGCPDLTLLEWREESRAYLPAHM